MFIYCRTRQKFHLESHRKNLNAILLTAVKCFVFLENTYENEELKNVQKITYQKEQQEKTVFLHACFMLGRLSEMNKVC